MKQTWNSAHYMTAAYFPVWRQLLRENRGQIAPDKRLQAAYLSFTTFGLWAAAGLERRLYDRRIRATRLTEPPLFVLGHWRTGTTFLQNLLAQDPNLAFADPVRTFTVSNCILLRPLMTVLERPALKNARPMDNMEYRLDLPTEENFGLATLTSKALIHMAAFPQNCRKYADYAFWDDLEPADRQEAADTYRYLLQKLTLLNHGRRLMLKSPDNTCRAAWLARAYPGSKFIHIYRNPYKVIQSTIHMFHTQFGSMTLQPLPDDEFVEDFLLELFERVYRRLWHDMEQIPADRFLEVRYEAFIQDPETHLRQIYTHLALPGFEEALPRFRAHLASQKNYQTNKFTLPDHLRRKINDRLGFFFEHYGYPRIEEDV